MLSSCFLSISYYKGLSQSSKSTSRCHFYISFNGVISSSIILFLYIFNGELRFENLLAAFVSSSSYPKSSSGSRLRPKIYWSEMLSMKLDSSFFMSVTQLILSILFGLDGIIFRVSVFFMLKASSSSSYCELSFTICLMFLRLLRNLYSSIFSRLLDSLLLLAVYWVWGAPVPLFLIVGSWRVWLSARFALDELR